jgi:Zn-dependent metalloprotease/subtilisin-like proprotein convertase family protein
MMKTPRSHLVPLAALAAFACSPSEPTTSRPDDLPPQIQSVHHLEKGRVAVSGDLAASARGYAIAAKAGIGFNEDDDFAVLASRRGRDGLDHVRLQQTYRGIPVFSADVVVHADNARFLGMGGRLGFGLAEVDTRAGLDAGEATAIAQADYAAGAKGASNLAFDRESAELMILPLETRGMRLVWHVRFFTELQAGIEPGLWSVFVDAADGTIQKKINSIHTLSQASGPGGNPKVPRTWTDALDVEPEGDQFKAETERLVTVDMNNSQGGSGTVVVGPLDDFGDAAINDAHGFAEVTLNMMDEWMGHNSIDDNGFVIRSRVHYGLNYENAFWDGTQMTYGDGASTFYPLSGDVDVVSHEISHGFTTFHSNLIYDNQSGGLNESFSDIAGTIAEFYVEGAGADWDIGRDIFQGDSALRFMCDPPADGISIDHFDDYADSIDVHFSSGISNKAFCLAARRLATGDPAGEATPESVRRAGEAWYEANANYWTTGTTFAEGCQGIIDAATALNFTPDEIDALNASWEDVGVFCTGPAPIVCDETLTGESGTLTSPNYPESYPNNFKRTWCIEPASGQPATLHFDDFDTETNFDFVRIRDANGVEVSNTSGTAAPADATSTLLAITFTSDTSVVRKGFSASWSTGGQENEPPVVAITEPTDGATVSGQVAIAADASDSDGAVARVVFSLPDGTTVEDNSAPYGAVWDSMSAADGDHQIVAEAFDDLGASAVSSVMVTVANGNECATGSYGSEDVVSIPDNNSTGITSSLSVSGGGQVTSLQVSVDISHTWRGDLRVTLVSPSGTQAILHDRTGSYQDDVVLIDVPVSAFDGEAAAGTWSLVVRDLASLDLGTLNSWSIDVIADCGGGEEWSASDAPDLPLIDNGTACTTVTVTADGDAADVQVDLVGQHAWRSILRATLEHGGIVATVFSTGTFPSQSGEFRLEDHAVAGFAGSAAGEWTLCIEDTDAFGDTGVLQSWAVHN